MATEDAVGADRESQAEVDAVLAETGVTMDQVRRWRREGLLAGRRPGPAGVPRQRGALSQRDMRPDPGGKCALQAKEPRRLRRASPLEAGLSGRRQTLAAAA